MTFDLDIPSMFCDDCLAIKDFSMGGQMQTVSISEHVMKNATKYLSKKSWDYNNYMPAKHQLIEAVAGRRLCALKENKTTSETTTTIATQTHLGREERDLPIHKAVYYCLDVHVNLKIFFLFGIMFMYDAYQTDLIFNVA